jgi:hypothetical protein
MRLPACRPLHVDAESAGTGSSAPHRASVVPNRTAELAAIGSAETIEIGLRLVAREHVLAIVLLHPVVRVSPNT